jgi:hypothetical protein
MMKNLTLAGAAALALTLGGGAAAAQAKAPTKSHASKKATVAVDHATREINVLDWVIPAASESDVPGLGLVTDLLEELLGPGGLLNGG